VWRAPPPRAGTELVLYRRTQIERHRSGR
jgi:hypothetical protein